MISFKYVGWSGSKWKWWSGNTNSGMPAIEGYLGPFKVVIW